VALLATLVVCPPAAAQTPPTATGAVFPAAPLAGDWVWITVTVTPRTPAITDPLVTVDLSAIGGAGSVRLRDDGISGDLNAHDHVFTVREVVPTATPAGPKSLPVSVSDALGATALSIRLDVGPPRLIGSAAPAVVNAGDAVLFTLQSAPGQPPLSQVAVLADDPATITGSTVFALNDAGEFGDVAAGDAVYSARRPVRSNAADGTHRVRLTATGEGPTSSADVYVTVIGAPGPPSGLGTLIGLGMPAPFAVRGGPVTVSVAVTPGNAPISTGLRVRLDLSRLGLSAAAELSDDGGGACDAVAGDRVFSACFVVPPGLQDASPFDIRGVVTDAQGRQAPVFVTTAVNGGPDTDGDGLSDACELTFGLNVSSPAGTDGATGDPDADGIDNAAECAAGTHPRGTFRRYFAEGAGNAFFHTRLSLFNPSPGAAALVLATIAREGGGEPRRLRVDVPPLTVVNLMPADTALLGEGPFSTVLESNVAIVADRTMTFGTDGEGSHLETALAAPATEWLLAEGATGWRFSLFYLLQNPNALPAEVDVAFLRGPGDPVLTHHYTLAPHSRRTIAVDDEEFPVGSGQRPLAATAVSGHVTVANGVPILVERAMYLSPDGRPFGGGHAAAGAPAPSTTWFFAEGATGTFFDEFLLLANAGATAATVDLTLMPEGVPGPPITHRYVVPANSRTTLLVDAIPGYADTALSARVVSDLPIVAERAMWWPGTGESWREGHVSLGARATAPRWAIAGLEVRGDHDAHAYVLVSGGGAVTLYPEGNGAPIPCGTAAGGRVTVDVNACLPAPLRFAAAIVEGNANTVVEWSNYRSANGEVFAAGGAALGTPLP
jgi:hypothetical protein